MLNRAKLEADLLQICRNPTDSYKVAADRFARAYANYMKDGTAGGAPPNPALIPGAERALAGTLMVAFKASKTYPVYASQVTSAISLFWTPFLVEGGFVGSVSALVITPPLNAALNAMLAGNMAVISGGGTITEQQAAMKLAAVLDTFTKTITVTFLGPAVFPLV